MRCRVRSAPRSHVAHVQRTGASSDESVHHAITTKVTSHLNARDRKSSRLHLQDRRITNGNKDRGGPSGQQQTQTASPPSLRLPTRHHLDAPETTAGLLAHNWTRPLQLECSSGPSLTQEGDRNTDALLHNTTLTAQYSTLGEHRPHKAGPNAVGCVTSGDTASDSDRQPVTQNNTNVSVLQHTLTARHTTHGDHNTHKLRRATHSCAPSARVPSHAICRITRSCIYERDIHSRPSGRITKPAAADSKHLL